MSNLLLNCCNILKSTSHKYPVNAIIFKHYTSHTKRLITLETATIRIRKLPHPQTPASATATAAFKPVGP